MTIHYNYNKLRGKIIEIYGNIKTFCAKTDMCNTLISAKLNGKTAFKQAEITKIVATLSIPDNEIGDYFFCTIG